MRAAMNRFLRSRASVVGLLVAAVALVFLAGQQAGWQIGAQEPQGGPVPSWGPPPEGVEVRTFAGAGPAVAREGGFRDGPAGEALFNQPSGLAIDSEGNLIVADFGNNRIRKVAPDGAVTTIAGTGEPGRADGPGATATFNGPSSVAVDAQGNIYVSDSLNHQIRRIDRIGLVSTVAGAVPEEDTSTGAASGLTVGGFRDGPAHLARFNSPAGIAVDEAGIVYVADKGNHRVRMISPDGMVSSLLGSGEPGFRDGQGIRAQFDRPVGLTLDAGGTLYVTEHGHFAVRKVLSDGTVSTLIRESVESALSGVAVDADGTIFLADGWTNQIRTIRPDGAGTTMAGRGQFGFLDRPASEALFAYPVGLAIQDKRIFVSDNTNHLIRVILR